MKITELLKISSDEYKDYKIHLAFDSFSGEVLNYFYNNEFKEYQEEQNKRNFNRKYIISFIGTEKNKWLFVGIYEVLDEPIKRKRIDGWENFKYNTRLLDMGKEFIGRVTVLNENRSRQSYPNLENFIKEDNNLELLSITEKRQDISDFLGFDNVNIDFKTLKYIISNDMLTWKSALSNVKGIYLITDKLTGKLYVGSAYGDMCIWQRWSEYSKNGHGGNKGLKALIEEKPNYFYNFSYSVLEVCNMNIGDTYIINREKHWKNILMTRTFGYNLN